MEIERPDNQTAVVHLQERLEADDSHLLSELFLSLYEEGVQVIFVDFSLTDYIHKNCLVPLILCQGWQRDGGAELKIVNVKGRYVRRLFDMLDLRRVINVEEWGENA